MLTFKNSHSGRPPARKKVPKKQALARREPRQERARYKVELILEGAARILDHEGMDALTTNRVAEVAGISIGTLYQYFNDKQAIVDALASRELEAMEARIMASLTGAPPATPGGRVRAAVRAVLGAFGGRERVHRAVLDRALTRATRVGGGQGMVARMLSTVGVATHGGGQRTLTPAEAFVVTQSFAGVMRGLVSEAAEKVDRAEVEDALVRMLYSFVAAKHPEVSQARG
jgi:AcrR family transcriptional regulator